MPLPRSKCSRTERGKDRPIEITDRDEEAMIFTGLNRYVSLTQLALDRFPSEDRCRRRVRALFNSAYLTITLVSSTRPNLISLTRKGLAFLESRHPELAGDLRLAGLMRLAGIDHHLAIVDARLYAAALGEVRGAPLIRWSNAGGSLHRELGLLDLHLVPDGLAAYSVSSPGDTTSNSSIVVAVEADLSTEPLNTIRRKLERYAIVAKQSRLDALWFLVVGGLERQRNIERLVTEAGLSEWARVLSHEHVLTRPVRELPTRGAAPQGTVPSLKDVTAAQTISVGDGHV